MLRSPISWSVVVLAWSAALAWLGLYATPHATLYELIMRWEPVWLSVHLAVLAVCGLIVMLRAWRRGRRFAVAALILGLLGPLFALMLAPRWHRIYYDEDIYAQIGHSIALQGWAGMVDCALPGRDGWVAVVHALNKEPTAYPFVVSLVTRLTGVSDETGMLASLVMFFVGIVAMGVLARELLPRGSRWWWIAPLLFALWPEALRWAVCSATEVAAASAACLAMASAARAARTRSSAEMLFSTLAVAFACQFRPEGVLLLAPWGLLAAGFLMNRKGSEAIGLALPYAAALAVLLFPHAVHLGSMSGEAWGASGPKFSMEYVDKNLSENLGYWFTSGRRGNIFAAPAWVMPLALLGGVVSLAASLGRREERLQGFLRVAALLLWLLLFFGVFVPFYAGSYYYGTDVRFSILAVPATLQLLGLFIARVGDAFEKIAGERLRLFALPIVLAALAVLFFPHLQEVRIVTPEARQSRADHEAVRIWAPTLPRDAVVVSHSPSMWTAHGVAGIQVNWAQRHPAAMRLVAERFPLYYHWGYWDIAGGGEIRIASGPTFLRSFPMQRETARFEAEEPWVYRLIGMQ